MLIVCNCILFHMSNVCFAHCVVISLWKVTWFLSMIAYYSLFCGTCFPLGSTQMLHVMSWFLITVACYFVVLCDYCMLFLGSVIACYPFICANPDWDTPVRLVGNRNLQMNYNYQFPLACCTCNSNICIRSHKTPQRKPNWLESSLKQFKTDHSWMQNYKTNIVQNRSHVSYTRNILDLHRATDQPLVQYSIVLPIIEQILFVYLEDMS